MRLKDSDFITEFDNPQLVVSRSKRAKRLALRLDSKERVVRLVIPERMSMRQARRFVADHVDWIEEKLQELPPALPFEHGRIVPILGMQREIDIFYDSAAKRTDIALKLDRLLVRTNKDDCTARIERFLKTLAKERLSEISRAKALDINKKISSISVRDTKSRWGSCSSDGRLSYSWRLIFAPSLAMDYVAAHEVAHLVHMDHSKNFWALCRALSIDFVEGEYWMRNHGHELMCYGARESHELLSSCES